MNVREPKPDRAKPLHAIAKEIIETRKRTSGVSPKALAHDLGVSYITLQRWLEGRYHIHAEKLPDLCRILDDFTLLDLLEARAGRVAFPIPDVKEPLAIDDLVVVQRLVKEVGEALQSLADTLKDHVVEDWEVERTAPELDDVIRECARLKHWLRQRSLEKRTKA